MAASGDYKLGTPRTSFSALIRTLDDYWADKGAEILQPWDTEMGAGTFHPATFFGALSKGEQRFAYVQPCRRPTDGRYGDNPNRLQRYYQYQVILKPAPEEVQELYLDSLDFIGVDRSINDIRFIEDNWESPTLGALGYGWEVWINGMEVTQFTFFQRIGGVPIEDTQVCAELTYGLERIAMYLADKDSVYDLPWTHKSAQGSSYGDMALRAEREFSAYNFEHANTEGLKSIFNFYEGEARSLIDKATPFPIASYDALLHSSHVFNLLDARRAISPTEREKYIERIYTLANTVATAWLESEAGDIRAEEQL